MITGRLQELQCEIATRRILSPRSETRAGTGSGNSGSITPPKVEERLPSARRSTEKGSCPSIDSKEEQTASPSNLVTSPSKQTVSFTIPSDQPNRKRKTPSIVPPLQLGKLQLGADSNNNNEQQQQQQCSEPQTQLQPHSGDYERLLAALQCDLGFMEDRPIAAVMVFRCCLKWKSLSETDDSPLFERVVNVLHAQVDLATSNNNRLAYLLSNCTALLHLILTRGGRLESGRSSSRAEKATPRLFSPRMPSPRLIYPSVQEAKGLELLGAFGAAPKGIGTLLQNQNSKLSGGVPLPPGQKAPIIYRRTSSAATTPRGSKLEVRRAPAGPALLFATRVEELVQRIFKLIRDNVKDDVSPYLDACIYAPRAEVESRQWTSKEGANSAAAEARLIAAWKRVVGLFDSLVNILRHNHVPTLIVQKLYGQLFKFLNVRLFNQLLLRGECCSFINGEYISTGLAEMEVWVESIGQTYLGSCMAQLRQAVDFLVNPLKHKMLLQEIENVLCPALSPAHLYRFSTLYRDGRFGTETVSNEVLAEMKRRMIERAASPSGRVFMLSYEDSTVPYSKEDVVGLFAGRDLLGKVALPEMLKSEPAFDFLQKKGDLSARC